MTITRSFRTQGNHYIEFMPSQGCIGTLFVNGENSVILETQSEEKGAERAGKARKVSDWEIKKVLNWVLKEKYSGRRMSFAQLCKHHNLPIHPRTLARRLAQLGYRKCTACPKPFINEKNRKIRLAFSVKFENWTHAWKRLRFSDESTFYTGKYKKDQILRKADERYCLDCIQTHFRSGRTSFLVWGMVGWGYKSKLVFLQNLSGARGGMTKEDYIKQVLLPVVSPYFQESNYISPYERTEHSLHAREFGEILFQEDRNRAHGLGFGKRNLSQLKDSFKIPLFNDGAWPPCSPDLNIIENVWRIIKQRIGSYDMVITTLDDMKKAVQHEWNEVKQEEIDNLVATMPSRIKQCKDREGNATKW